jgi:PAS domain S-box-containing protein
MLYWSEEMFRIFAFDPREGLPTNERFWERIHPEDRDSVHEVLRMAVHGKTEYVHDHRLVLPDGTVKHIHAIGHPVLNAAGDVVEFVGTSVDVTERKRAEDELRRAETRFRTYVDHATDALLVHDEEGTVLEANQQACVSLGYTREELIGMHPRIFNPAIDSAAHQWVRERLEAGEIFTFETTHQRKDGIVFPVEVRLRPFWDNGRVFALALVQDITERKRAEQERDRLQQLQAELARMNRVTTMGELTASLAHEINQPIAAAVTNASTSLRWLANDPPNIEEAREAAKRSVKDANRAAEIICRIRQLFTKGTAERELLDINEVIREMIVLLLNEAHRFSISLSTDLDTNLPSIMADRVQLQQVLMNLMLNGIDAVKDVDGNRELTIRSGRQDRDLLISVTDTGRGLPANAAEKIFDAFFTTKTDGTGMGLSISRSIIESHGGRLWAMNNTLHGATFYFTLPTNVEAQDDDACWRSYGVHY